MLIKIFLSAILSLVICNGISAQSSENNERLKQALKRFPKADANRDGILTLAEARAFLKRNPEVRPNQERTQRDTNPIGGQRHIYKSVGDAELALYVFAPNAREHGSQVPAVVFFFGGGWTNGSPRQFQAQCEYLASRGVAGITVDYRVASRYPVTIKDCVEDAKSAMRWVRAHAESLGIDPDRIASAGGSAGGHLAACTAVIEDVNADSDDLDVSAVPNAMILFNPALMIAPDDRMNNEEKRRAEEFSKRTRDALAKLSPLNFASREQPPMIMFFGTEDRLLRGAKFFRSDSISAGNSCRIVTYEGQGHSFFNRQKYRDLTMQEMDQFLVELEWLQKSN